MKTYTYTLNHPDSELSEQIPLSSFMKEKNILLAIEHDLKTKELPFPSKIEGISAADMSIMELFFDMSTLENA